MGMWFYPITVDDLNKRSHNTLAEFLGISFVEITEDTLVATMPAHERTKQPLGIVHGGANVVLAETIASTAANMAIDYKKFYCVGLEINANHLRPVSSGILKAVTRCIHLGRTTQVWNIDIFNEDGKQTCVSRMTAAVIAR